MNDRDPYAEVDEPVRELVRVLNELEGIETLGSCGGHEDGKPGEMRAAADEWWVTMTLEPADLESEVWAPSEQAWLDVEFLVYWVGRLEVEKGFEVGILPYAPPPQLNEPGRMLRFEFRGYRAEGKGSPDDVAAWIRDGLSNVYTAVGGNS
jgi:hypothetical protein